MGFAFNPFTGNFDVKGAGGGASYIDGEVAVYADLPLDGTAALNSAWLVRSSSGIWPFNKPGGIYIRTATAGSSRDADYTYAGTMPDVFSDAVLTIYDEASTTRTGQFNLGNITAGQNRVLTWPNASGTIALTSDIAAGVTSVTGTAPISSSGGATPAISISAATTSAAGSMSSADKIKLDGIAAGAEVNVNADWNASSGDAQILNKPTSLTPTAHAASHAAAGSDPVSIDASQVSGLAPVALSNSYAELDDLPFIPAIASDIGAANASHTHGNLTNEGKVGSTSGLPLVTTTAGAVTTLALGTAGQVLRTKSDLSGVEFADPAAAGVTSVTGTAPIVSSGGTTPAISISAATTSAAGSMSSADKVKLDAISGSNTGDQTITLTGDVTGSGTGSFAATIANDAVTYAKMQNISATSRVLGRKTAAAGDTEECTLSEILDFVGSAAQGDILYRGASTWTRLAAGTSGHYLKTNGSAANPEWAAVSGGSGGTKTYAVFTAEHNQPPATAFATLDTRNSIAVLDFDAATDENAVFVGIMPEAASLGSGLIVRLHWMATSATSGNVRWGVQFERSNTDLDSDSFAAVVEANGAANGTSGILTTTAITVTDFDGITAGDVFRLRVSRNADDATNDTMTGDAELVAVEVRSAA